MAKGRSHMPQHGQGGAIHHTHNPNGRTTNHVSPLGGVSNAPVAAGQGLPVGGPPAAAAPAAPPSATPPVLPPGMSPVGNP